MYDVSYDALVKNFKIELLSTIIDKQKLCGIYSYKLLFLNSVIRKSKFVGIMSNSQRRY